VWEVLDMEQSASLNNVNHEILTLREKMYALFEQVRELSHPQLVEISQLLDEKLNDRRKLLK
jgi:hypothetical protein